MRWGCVLGGGGVYVVSVYINRLTSAKGNRERERKPGARKETKSTKGNQERENAGANKPGARTQKAQKRAKTPTLKVPALEREGP